MEHPRTTSARDHDDKALTEAADRTPSFIGRSGGNLAADVVTQAELDAIEAPAKDERVTKQDDIDHAAEVRPGRAPNAR